MGGTFRVVTDTKMAGLTALSARMRSLKDTVLIGVPAGAKEPDGTSMAEIAARNEFGSADGTTPERPALRTGIRRGQPLFRRIGEAGLRGIVQGKTTEAVVLGRLGLAGVAAVQSEIVNGDFAPNAPSTIAKKGSDKPLIESGSFRQHITYVIDGGQRGPEVIR